MLRLLMEAQESREYSSAGSGSNLHMSGIPLQK